MHRRYFSGSGTELGHSERVLLQKRASTHGALARTKSTGYAGPSRFRAEAEAYHSHECASAVTTASQSRSGKSPSEDQIVCQSKLYDAFELQELERHLDRKLSFRNDHETRSISILSSGQASLNCQKSPRAVPNFLNDRTSITADHLRERSMCACHFCNSNGKNPSLSSLIDGCGLPRGITQSVTTVSDIIAEPAHLQAEARCSSTQPGAYKNDPSQDENHASYVPTRSFSRAHYDCVSAGPAHVDVQEQEALQAGLREYADHYAISSTTNTLKAHKQRKAKSGRWSLLNSLIRSLRAIRKEENNMDCMKEARALPSLIPGQEWNKEYHHYHHVVHYHHVHHHHHHHVMNGVHFEEIDWPLSPARLEELGWLMSNKCHTTKDC